MGDEKNTKHTLTTAWIVSTRDLPFPDALQIFTGIDQRRRVPLKRQRPLCLRGAKAFPHGKQGPYNGYEYTKKNGKCSSATESLHGRLIHITREWENNIYSPGKASRRPRQVELVGRCPSRRP